MKPENRGMTRLVAAFRNSKAGLNDLWQREEAFRIEATLFLLAVPVSFWLCDSLGHVGVLLGSLLILLIVEALNSAIEACIDRFGEERHEMSRIAKDVASAAVFMAMLIPVAAWGASVLYWMDLIAL